MNFSLGCIVNLFPFNQWDRLGPAHDGKGFEELSREFETREGTYNILLLAFVVGEYMGLF